MRRYKAIVGGKGDSLVDKYVSSMGFDEKIAKYAAMVMLAHAKGLTDKGLMPWESYEVIASELSRLAKGDGKGLYEWVASSGGGFEDIFEVLEAYLYEKVGPDAGRLAAGRSRNDHVAAVLRIALRDRVAGVLSKVLELREALLAKGEKYRDAVFPFFTHAQIAQCGSAAIYFLSYEQAFSDLWRALYYSLCFLNQNPLGSGAASGSFIELDLDSFSKSLCLEPEPLPPYYATGSRLFLLYVVSALALLMAEVSRFVEDVFLVLNTASRGVLLPVNHISTSSIMPHKRNPVTLEVARAKASKVIGYLTSLLSAYKSVPYGYNLDFQEMNAQVFSAIEDVTETLGVLIDFVKRLELDPGEMLWYLSDKPCWSSDLIEYLAVRENKPVRELYVELAMALQVAREGNRSALVEFFKKHGISEEKLFDLFKQKPVERKLGKLLEKSRKRILEDSEKLNGLLGSLKQCYDSLLR